MLPFLQDCKRVEDEENINKNKVKFGVLCLEPEVADIFTTDENQWEVFNFFGFNLSTDGIHEKAPLEMVVQQIRLQINNFEEAAVKNTTLPDPQKIRQDLVIAFKYLRLASPRFESNTLRKFLSLLRILLKPIALHPKKDLFTQSCGGINDKSGKNQYFHGYLEWRWNYLILLLQLELTRVVNTEAKLLLPDTQFEIEFRLLLLDLTTIPNLKFARHSQEKNLLQTLTHSVGCDCLFEIWKSCLSLAESLRNLHFFGSTQDYLKQIIDASLNGGLPHSTLALCDRLPDSPFFQRMKRNNVENSSTNMNDNTQLFSICLLSAIVKQIGSMNTIQCGELLTEATLALIKTEPSEDKLRLLILLIAPILLNYWEPNCDIITAIWSSLHKRINSAYHMQTAALDALVIATSMGSDFLSEVRLELNSDFNMKRSSFSNFLSLVSRSLINLRHRQQKSQSNRIIGRIFSKLNVSKLIGLSERGLHNLSQLLVTLGMSCDLQETGTRLLDILLQMQFAKLLPERQKIMFKTHIAMVTLFHENNQDLTKYFERLIAQQKDNPNENEIILKLLAHIIQNILIKSETFDNGLNLLIGPWITLYVFKASDPEKRNIFASFLLVAEKLQLTLSDKTIDRKTQQTAMQMLKAMFDYVLPSIKQNYLKQGNIFEVPKLAALFCATATGADGLPSGSNLINFFTDLNRPNIKYNLMFFKEILNGSIVNKITPDVVVQNWIHFYLVLEANDTVDFHEKVLLLPEIQNLFSRDALNEIECSRAPLTTFFDQLFRLYFTSNDFQYKSEISANAERYLTNFEKWATQQHSEDVTMRVYQFITKLLFQCGPMFYSKAKSSCFLNTVFQHFILTPNVMMGKNVPPATIRGVSKAFSYLAELLIRLNYRQDMGLMEKLNHLINKWTPLMRMSSNPIGINSIIAAYVRLLRKIETDAIEHVISQFCNAFLSPNGRMPGNNSQWASSVLKAILMELSVDTIRVTAVLNGSLNVVLEHVILVDDSNSSRKLLLEMLSETLRISTAPSIHSTILNALRTNTKRRLIHYEKLFFNFIRQLARACPSFTKKFIPYLREAITDVENMLGVTRDSGLRNSLASVEEILK